MPVRFMQFLADAFYLKIKSPIHGRRKDFFHEGTNSGFSKGNCCVFPWQSFKTQRTLYKKHCTLFGEDNVELQRAYRIEWVTNKGDGIWRPTKKYRARKTNKRAAWNKSFAGRNNHRRGICAKRAQVRENTTLTVAKKIFAEGAQSVEI